MMVFVASIILLITGGLGLLGVLTIVAATNSTPMVGMFVFADTVELAVMAVAMVPIVIAAILGIRHAANLRAHGMLFGLGIALVTLQGINLVSSLFYLSGSPEYFAGAVVNLGVALLYFVGANTMRREARAVWR